MSLGKDGPPPHGGSQSNSNTEKVDHSLAPLDADKTRPGGLLSPPRMVSFMQRMQRMKRLQSQATSARVQVDQKIMEASNSRRHVSLCDASLMKAVQIMAAEGKFNGSEELLALYEECQKARDVLGPIEEEEFEERGNWFEKMWKLKEIEESFYDDFEEEFQAADTYSPGSPSVDSRYYESPSEHEAQILNLQFDQHFNKSLESILPLPASLSVSSKDEPSPRQQQPSSVSIVEEVLSVSSKDKPSPHQQQSLSENMAEEVPSVSSKYEPSPHQNQPSSESIVEEVPQYLPKFDRSLPPESNTSVSDSSSQCTDSNVSLDGPLTEEKETQVFDYDSRSSTDFDREQRDPPPITWLNADPDEAVHTLPGIELYPELLTQFVTKRERVTKWLLQTTLLSPMDASLLKRRLDSENPKSPSNWAQLVIAWWDKDKSATAKTKVVRRDNESGTAQAHPKSVAEQRVVTKSDDEISRNSTFPPSKVPSIQNPEPSVSNENPQSLQYLLSPGNDPMGPEPTSFSEAAHEFSTLLFDHEDLKPIFLNSPKALDASTFVQILKIILEEFSQDLIKGAKNLTERATAHFVRDSRQKVTKALGGRLYGSSLNEPVTSVLDNPEQYYTDIAPFPQLLGKDEISDDGENDDNYAFPSWKEMKLFILESGALSSFRSAFEQLQMADQDLYQTLWAHIQNGKVPGTGVDSGYESSVISGNIGILADHSGEEISKMPVSSVEIAAVAGAEQQSSATDTKQGLFTSRPNELGPVDPPSATTAQMLKPQNRQVEIAPLSSNVVLRPGPEDASDLPQNQPDIANGNITSHIVSPTADPTLDTTMHIKRKLSTFGPDLEVHPSPINLLSRNKADVYPAAWSPWEWNDAWQMESRWRQVRVNGEEEDFDYEYRYANAPKEPPVNVVPVDPLSTITESPNEHEEPPSNYTYQVSSYSFSPTERTQYPAQPHQIIDKNKVSAGAGNEQNNYSLQGQGLAHHISTIPALKSTINSRHIRTGDTDIGVDLNSNFKLHPSSEWAFGRVFKVLWSEPTGSGGTNITGVRRAKHGESVYSSIRRFVIIRELTGHCVCLPILTYGGQATLKKGVKADDHCVVYTSDKPVMKSKERITKKSIRIIPNSPRDKLDPASRMNYAKVYTVEQNIKVQFIGHVAQKHQQQLITDYNSIHKPLQDRPHNSGTSEDTFAHTEGAEPRYYSPVSHILEDSNYPDFASDEYSSARSSCEVQPIPYSQYAPRGTHVTDHGYQSPNAARLKQSSHQYDQSLYEG